MAISMDARIDKPLAVPAGDERFFLGAAFAMTLVIVAGFSTQLAIPPAQVARTGFSRWLRSD